MLWSARTLVASGEESYSKSIRKELVRHGFDNSKQWDKIP